MTSEFGKGCTYCLGLFLAHAERSWGPPDFDKEQDERMKDMGKVNDYSFSTELWFNGASDHLYDLEIPDNFPVRLKSRLKKLQSKSLYFGHGFGQDTTNKDKMWAIEEAKELLRLIDNFLGIKTSKAQWS